MSTEVRDRYHELFALREQGGGVADAAWSTGLRHRGFERFAELGWPTTRMEDWRHTNPAPLASLEVTLPPAGRVLNGAARRILNAAPVLPGATDRLVFVDGCYAPGLSYSSARAGLVALPLAVAARAQEDLVLRHLASIDGGESGALSALNQAFLADGAFVWLGEEACLEGLVEVIHVSTAGDDCRPAATFPRTLVVAGAGARAVLVERYVCAGETTHFANAVTEVYLAPDASLAHCRVTETSARSYHVSSTVVHQHAGSVYRGHAITVGGALVRNDLAVALDGVGASAVLAGLFVADGREHLDNHTLIRHNRASCTSRELYKGILADHATGVFRGKIVVAPLAQKTDSRQTNRNLLLSQGATIHSQPQLEIYADDVKCTHGAATGRLDEESVFYLCSRGISLPDARGILTGAFAAELLDGLPSETLGEQLRDTLHDRVGLVRLC
ncbi:MAG: Fe-S cluster assembly protein SufD [Candidatus Schekmanbacteria bacterium]|nr:Fe-S cluster assembly protein SufD [Candidatus Schekmanbacteria bacterium]